MAYIGDTDMMSSRQLKRWWLFCIIIGIVLFLMFLFGAIMLFVTNHNDISTVLSFLLVLLSLFSAFCFFCGYQSLKEKYIIALKRECSPKADYYLKKETRIKPLYIKLLIYIVAGILGLLICVGLSIPFFMDGTWRIAFGCLAVIMGIVALIICLKFAYKVVQKIKLLK